MTPPVNLLTVNRGPFVRSSFYLVTDVHTVVLDLWLNRSGLCLVSRGSVFRELEPTSFLTLGYVFV